MRYWLVSAEKIETVGMRVCNADGMSACAGACAAFVEAVGPGAAAQEFGRQGARGLVILQHEDGERSVWRVSKAELFYARPAS